MKLNFLLFILLSGSVVAADPPPAPRKLVPRPIPGLELPLPEALITPLFPEPTPPAPATPSPATTYPTPSTTPDQARIVYIHRRATLPAQFTHDLPAAAVAKSPGQATAMPIRVSDGAVKIIPKSEAAKMAKAEDQP